MRQIALFGVRSPLTVEYEETCRRAGIAIPFAVSVAGAPRLAMTETVVELGELAPHHLAIACLACAFVPARRRELVAIAHKAGFAFADALVDPTATVASSSRLGAGSYVNAGSVIGALSMIGDHALVNRSSSVGHHAVLADYVSIGPGVTIASNVRIGEGAIVGAGCTILPDLRIGAGVVVAAGSVVRRNIADGGFVAGNPAVERAFDIKASSLNTPEAE